MRCKVTISDHKCQENNFFHVFVIFKTLVKLGSTFSAKKLWNQSWICKLKNIRVRKEPSSLTDKLGSGRQVYPQITSQTFIFKIKIWLLYMKPFVLNLQHTLKIALSRRQIHSNQRPLGVFWDEISPNGLQIRKEHEKATLRLTGFVIWTILRAFFSPTFEKKKIS